MTSPRYLTETFGFTRAHSISAEKAGGKFSLWSWEAEAVSMAAYQEDAYRLKGLGQKGA